MSQDRAQRSGSKSASGRLYDLPPSVADFAESRSLKRHLLDELRSGWEQGNPVPPQELLQRWPGDPNRDPDVASLLFEDYCNRYERGEVKGPDDYEHRFPEHVKSFRSLSHQQGLLKSLGTGRSTNGLLLSLPGIGDELFGFKMLSELGRGSFARVFLAEQKELADRPVVAKVSAIDGDEARTLAQLQHTHIVPIYSVHEDAAAGLRLVCMPYFGGASLSKVLQAVWMESDSPRNGSEITQALENTASPWNADGKLGQATGEEGEPAPSRTIAEKGAIAILERLSYSRASIWIVARLAEALQHAHSRGVQHRDIKPSNILLSADGQPMLLDFNLSQSLGCDNAKAAATLGGTVAYMSPEHLRALATRDPALVRRVDHRADIYGLGMVLFEMLTGRRPFDQSASYSPIPALIDAMAIERAKAAPSLKSLRPDSPWSLESIVRKCLAPEPSERYQHAEQLAEDLRRFLDDRPLKFAPELSISERLVKLGRRHPRVAVGLGAAAAIAIVVGLATAYLLQTNNRLKVAQARAQEAEGAEARETRRVFREEAERARGFLNTTTGVKSHLTEGLTACETALAYYDVLQNNDWQQHPAWRLLDDRERRTLEDDICELLILLGRARVQQSEKAAGENTANPARTVVIRDALQLLDRVQAVPGHESSAALWNARASYHEQLGSRMDAKAALEKANSIPAQSAQDFYLLGISQSESCLHPHAVKSFKNALQRNPRHYWSWFALGNSYCEMKDYGLALGNFDACVALWPEFAWGYFNRGHVLQQLGKTTEALEQYSTTLELDPRFAEAHLNRGLLQLTLNQPGAALDDFDAALNLGLDNVVAHGGRGLALEALGRFESADAAFAKAWSLDPVNLEMLLGYGFAVSQRLPDRAKSAFDRVLKRDPRNTRALYGCAMLLAREVRGSETALAYCNLALEADPIYVPARTARANILAHRGEWELARQDIDWCVKADPSGVTIYAAACIYSLAANKSSGQVKDALRNRAIALLREAFRSGYGMVQAAQDTDLLALREHPEFSALLRAGVAPQPH